jgi:spoIIIJ-associated protein
MTKKDQAKINDVIKNVLSLMGMSSDQFEVTYQDEAITVQLNLPDDESGVYIGHQGETLASLQLVLALIVSQRLDQWIRVKLNVGDYQQRREQQLLSKADLAAGRAIETGQEIILPGLNSYERHLVHDYLAANTTITTASRGEEPNRQLFVSPAK